MDLTEMFRDPAPDLTPGPPAADCPGVRAPAPERSRMLRAAPAPGSGPRHILYVPGPGDVAGTYRHWVAGRDDPSIPSIAYSAQVYEVAAALGARLTVLSETPPPGDLPAGPVAFRQAPQVRGRGLGYHLSEIGYGLRLVARARAAGADTILMQRMLTHFWPLGLARLFGIRIVLSLHNTLWPVTRGPSRRERLIGRLNGWLFRRAGRIVGVSQAIADQVRRLAGPTARTAVHVPQYKSALAHAIGRRRGAAGLARVLYLGRIEEAKGVFVLLDAFARVAAAHPGLGLRFVGTGHALEALRAAAARTGLADRIEIPGPCDGAQVFAELARADLLVCPTTTRFSEGLAKTPLEAALAGVPSLVSAVVPAADLLGDAVETVAPDDTPALAAALEALARDPARCAAMAAAAAERRGQVFDRTRSLAVQLYGALARPADRAPSKGESSVLRGIPVLGRSPRDFPEMQ